MIFMIIKKEEKKELKCLKKELNYIAKNNTKNKKKLK
jgi:hypothetical protein